MVFNTGPLSRFVKFLVLTNLLDLDFLELCIVRVFLGHLRFDGVTDKETEEWAATWFLGWVVSFAELMSAS
jgi:hypothetical protein